MPRNALVTGAGTGIGRAIALELAKAGYDVALHCNASREGAESAAAEIRALGRRAEVYQADLRDIAAIGAMFDLYLDIYDKYFAGDRAGAIEAHNFILPILNHIRQNVEEIIYFEKKILCKRGIIATDVCRRPTFSVDDEFEKLFEEYYALTAPRFRHV